MQIFENFTHTLGYVSPFDLPTSSHAYLRYEYAYTDYLLDDAGKQRVLDYINTQMLFLDDYGDATDADFLLAFSFGDGDSVNRSLAMRVEETHLLNPNLPLYLQVEISQFFNGKAVIAIDDSQYQTTADVANKVKQQVKGSRVVVIAQAWHAKRCVTTCEEMGLEVVALRTVNKFSINDCQPWVRNPINWVIKESHRGTGNGFDISEQYRLV